MSLLLTREDRRDRRHARVRSRVSGTKERPRLSVFRSLTGMVGQLIDDETGLTLVSVNSKVDAKNGTAPDRTGKVAQSYILGKAIAEKAKAAHISLVVFDRGGYAYHGRVRAFAEGARDGGLVF